MRNDNDFDVYEGFRKAVTRLVNLLDSEMLPKSGTIRRGDCRDLSAVKRGSIDAIVTSPPYLNAIDYLRGHKLSLVWLGHTTAELRDIRAGAVGTERAGSQSNSDENAELENAVRSIRKLPKRQRAIVRKYAQDAALLVAEMKRVLAPDGLMVLVLGDSNLRGVPVYNSRIFNYIAAKQGFLLEEERQRPLQSNRRYLPIAAASGALAKRMKNEVLQAYRLTSNA
jgi:DNA modification methylase